MTVDLKLVNLCDHKISEILNIEGENPNYFAILDYVPSRSRKNIKIHDYTTIDSYESFALNTDGITNWQFDLSNDRRINFPYNEDLLSIDGNTNILPKHTYVINYTTTSTQCPKCNNTFKVQDINFDNIGRLSTLTGTEKVKQQIVKILLTVVNDNLYDSAYGSTINSSIGQKFTQFITASIQYSIHNAIQHLMLVQEQNNLPDNERIIGMSDITIDETDDVRKLKLSISVILGNGSNVSASINFNLK